MDSYVLIVLVSLVSLIIGVKFWQKGNLLIETGITTSGTIFKNNFKGAAGFSHGMYYPVVRFLTERKEWITQELSIGRNPPIKEGSKVTVIYDPEDPTNVDIRSTFRQEILPRILLAIGVAGIIIGLLGYLELIEFGL